MDEPDHADRARTALKGAGENLRAAGAGQSPERRQAAIDAANITALVGIGHALLAVAQEIRRARP